MDGSRGKRLGRVRLAGPREAGGGTPDDGFLASFFIVLVGLAANAKLGWWWADPVAAVEGSVFIARESVEAWRGEDDRYSLDVSKPFDGEVDADRDPRREWAVVCGHELNRERMLTVGELTGIEFLLQPPRHGLQAVVDRDM